MTSGRIQRAGNDRIEIYNTKAKKDQHFYLTKKEHFE